jgi:drug/metabolite transporter (DMT)-like permease
LQSKAAHALRFPVEWKRKSRIATRLAALKDRRAAIHGGKSMTGRDWARLLVLATVWSASFFLAAVALRSFGPMTIAACRVGMGALFLLGWMAAVGRTAPPIAPWRDYIVMGLLNNAVPFTLIFWAQQGIESGLAAILNATTPFFTAIRLRSALAT